MKTHNVVLLYKVTNSIDDRCFHGYTTTTLSSRFASLKREATNAQYRGQLHTHMRKLGKEHFKISHVETFKDVALDEVKRRLTELEPHTQQTQEQEPEQEQETQTEPVQEAQTEQNQEPEQTQPEPVQEEQTEQEQKPEPKQETQTEPEAPPQGVQRTEATGASPVPQPEQEPRTEPESPPQGVQRTEATGASPVPQPEQEQQMEQPTAPKASLRKPQPEQQHQTEPQAAPKASLRKPHIEQTEQTEPNIEQEQQTETQTEPNDELETMSEQEYIDYVYDIVNEMSETGCVYQYLERENIDQMELLRKFNVIGWVLIGAHRSKTSPRENYLAVADKVAKLGAHLQMLYTSHSINQTRLCTHDKMVYDMLKQLTQRVTISDDIPSTP